jgi:serine/threonine-protein kinase
MGTPRRIGPYEILAIIGQGGMAAVYKAYQASLDRIVAIKVISSSLATEAEFMGRFRQEALAIAKLTHPNIIIVHDFGDDNGTPYLVMEFIDGATLADEIETGIAPDRALDVLGQIAAGLDFAHSRGIVHRDIKPQNVLVTQEGRAVLADFGLARMMENAPQLTMSGGIVGTPEYMSPEQAAGKTTDHRTDIYALGVILYEMLAGERPFIAETPLGVLMKHLQDMPRPISQIHPDAPRAVDAVLAKALAKKPEDRYQSAGSLVRAFRDAVAPTPQSSGSTPISPVEPALPNNGSPAPDPSRYGDLRREAQRAERPHMTPSLIRLGYAAPPPIVPPPVSEAPPLAPTGVPTRTCPKCSAVIPADVTSFCPNCLSMLPYEEARPRVRLLRKIAKFNLLPYHLRWDPPGLERAREIAQNEAVKLQQDGWEIVGGPEFQTGNSAIGDIVRMALITVQRYASAE